MINLGSSKLNKDISLTNSKVKVPQKLMFVGSLNQGSQVIKGDAGLKSTVKKIKYL